MQEKYFKRIETGAIIADRKEGVFCFIYSENSKPHISNSELDSDTRNQSYPEIAMIMNWRAGFGFPGGTVDEDEVEEHGIKGARKVAVLREVKEEINFEMNNDKLSDILCTHDLGDFVVHMYAYKVTEKELLEIRDGIKNASHSRSEAIGFNLIPCVNIGKNGDLGLPMFLSHNIGFAVREELVIGIDTLKLIPKEELSLICKKAGYSYKRLLGK